MTLVSDDHRPTGPRVRRDAIDVTPLPHDATEDQRREWEDRTRLVTTLTSDERTIWLAQLILFRLPRHLTVTAVIIARHLMEMVDANGRIWVSIAHLADLVGCHYSTAAAAIDRLEEWGFLVRQHRKQRNDDGWYNMCNAYALTMTKKEIPTRLSSKGFLFVQSKDQKSEIPTELSPDESTILATDQRREDQWEDAPQEDEAAAADPVPQIEAAETVQADDLPTVIVYRPGDAQADHVAELDDRVADGLAVRMDRQLGHEMRALRLQGQRAPDGVGLELATPRHNPRSPPQPRAHQPAPHGAGSGPLPLPSTHPSNDAGSGPLLH